MTWLKLGDEFADECARAGLSDAAFRTHVEGLGWAMRRLTGGDVDARDVRRFAETTDPDAAVRELVAAGLWQETATGWRIVHHLEHQPTPQVVEARRVRNAERQRRHRQKLAGIGESRRYETRDPGRDGTSVGPSPDPPPPDVARDLTRDLTRDQRDTEPPSSDLLMVVVGALPDDLGQQLDRRTLRGVLHELAGRGWTPDALTAAAGARSWTGAGPGAVVAWLRGLDQPTPARPRPQPRGARCPAGSPIAADGSCCGTRHEEGAA